jgi:hypothetical protein
MKVASAFNPALFARDGAEMFIEIGRPTRFRKLRMERYLIIIEKQATLTRTVCRHVIVNEYAAPLERKTFFGMQL